MRASRRPVRRTRSSSSSCRALELATACRGASTPMHGARTYGELPRLRLWSGRDLGKQEGGGGLADRNAEQVPPTHEPQLRAAGRGASLRAGGPRGAQAPILRDFGHQGEHYVDRLGQVTCALPTSMELAGGGRLDHPERRPVAAELESIDAVPCGLIHTAGEQPGS
jgi:hypothetical protein